jgi:hypothetical protein
MTAAVICQTSWNWLEDLTLMEKVLGVSTGLSLFVLLFLVRTGNCIASLCVGT